LHGPVKQPDHLDKLVFAVMVSNFPIFYLMQVGKRANLEAVAGRDHCGISAPIEFVDYGLEQRHMGRIIQIDPYAFAAGLWHVRALTHLLISKSIIDSTNLVT
jgi:hypothetical protein